LTYVNRINSVSALSFIAIAALALSVSSAVEAATAKSGGMANTGTAIHQPKKATYGKKMRAHWGSGCKMSGTC
jgi:phosphate-selective porin